MEKVTPHSRHESNATQSKPNADSQQEGLQILAHLIAKRHLASVRKARNSIQPPQTNEGRNNNPNPAPPSKEESYEIES